MYFINSLLSPFSQRGFQVTVLVDLYLSLFITVRTTSTNALRRLCFLQVSREQVLSERMYLFSLVVVWTRRAEGVALELLLLLLDDWRILPVSTDQMYFFHWVAISDESDKVSGYMSICLSLMEIDTCVGVLWCDYVPCPDECICCNLTKVLCQKTILVCLRFV